MPTVHILIKGKVQGVFYRATAKEIANELGLRGWVKNTSDGNVEVKVTGNQQQLDKFVKWCNKGPDRAVVEDVVVTQKEETTFNSFVIVR